MSKIDSMPPMCHDCPNWEFCEFPYVCPDTEQTKQPEQKHGHWKLVQDNDDEYWQCSACGCEWYLVAGTPEENAMHYCPECGAKMEEEVKSDVQKSD